jgi:hypothetical protein
VQGVPQPNPVVPLVDLDTLAGLVMQMLQNMGVVEAVEPVLLVQQAQPMVEVMGVQVLTIQPFSVQVLALVDG